MTPIVSWLAVVVTWLALVGAAFIIYTLIEWWIESIRR